MRFRVQVWWGDGWSYGTVYPTERLAREAIALLEREGYTCRIVSDLG